MKVRSLTAAPSRAIKAHEAEWARRGRRRTVEDPREIADNFRQYAGWEAMPGAGVCGIRVVKPARPRD